MKKLTQQGITPVQVILFITGLVLTISVGWYLLSVKDEASISNFEQCKAAGNPIMESYPEQCAANGQTFVNEAQEEDVMAEATSGKGTFAVTFPADWGNILRDTQSDFFIIPGQEQPEGRVNVEDIEGYGSDALSVFSISVDKDADGTDNVYYGHKDADVTDYTLENAKENPIKGKKYSYSYPKDEQVGIGYWRYQGDRDYEYVFDLPGSELIRVNYSVYGVDPRNNLETVEQVINSIRLLQ